MKNYVPFQDFPKRRKLTSLRRLNLIKKEN